MKNAHLHPDPMHKYLHLFTQRGPGHHHRLSCNGQSPVMANGRVRPAVLILGHDAEAGSAVRSFVLPSTQSNNVARLWIMDRGCTIFVVHPKQHNASDQRLASLLLAKAQTAEFRTDTDHCLLKLTRTRVRSTVGDSLLHSLRRQKLESMSTRV